jgi:hypothetical protein
MNTKLQLISLTLTNVANADSEVNLLSSQAGTDNNAFDSYYRLAFQFDIDGFLFQYILNGTTYGDYFYAEPNINTFIFSLNTLYSSYAVFSYEIDGSAPNYILTIRVTNSNFVPYALITLG